MVTSTQIDRLVEHFCCAVDTHCYGPYQPDGGPGAPLEGVELLPGRLWRYRLQEPGGEPVQLHVYAGLRDLGGALWEQELRVLFRLGGFRSGGIPEVLSGGYRDEASCADAGVEVPGVAIVATRGADLTMADPAGPPFMRERRELALNRFGVLAGALARLHDHGVCHRRLGPAAISCTSDESPQMWIARFEMSTIIGNLLRSETPDSAIGRAELRNLFLADGDGLGYRAPEQLPYLLDAAADTVPELTDRSDVYTLAATVWPWFCGPFPDEAVPALGAPDAAARMAALRARLREEARRAAHVPPLLRRLLVAMLADEPDARPSAADVAERLAKELPANMAFWSRDKDADRPHLVIYMPGYSDATLFNWNWLTHRSDTEEGKAELATVIADDLRQAIVVYSEQGAAPFVSGGEKEDKREARYVLVGARAAWFCQPYRRRKGFGQLGSPLETALVIKYVVEKEHRAVRRHLEELVVRAVSRPLPAFEAVPDNQTERAMDTLLQRRPSWRPLMEAVHVSAGQSHDDQQHLRRLDWALAYQGALLKARTYAFTRAAGGPGQGVAEIDKERDTAWLDKDAILSKFAVSPRHRPDLGDFFASLDTGESRVVVQVARDRNGRPDWSDSTEWQFTGRSGPDRITLTPVPGEGNERHRVELPENGWLRPADDRGSQSALHRQGTAFFDLAGSPRLLRQLRKPRSVRTMAHRWEQAGRDLEGEEAKKTKETKDAKNAKNIVRDMLTYQPIFAVHGPPGTGKTTVVAEAVRRFLTVEPGARVLVSAQSGYALDNLAERILRRLGALDDDDLPAEAWPGVAIRVAGATAAAVDRVDPKIRPWLRDRAAGRELDWIRDRVEVQLENEHAPAVRAVLARWRGMLEGTGDDDVELELGERMQRAANLVFATCAMATPQNVTEGGGRSQFDWVIVEEAAKAWPGELTIPLVRGYRWTLIGDHKQLGAYQGDEFVRFLNDCQGDPDPELKAVYDERAEYLKAFRPFDGLFAELDETAPSPRHDPPPLRRLTAQYRMRDPIAQVVGRVFYPVGRPGPDGLAESGLTNGREVPAAPLRKPAALAGRSLVWLDTGEEADCRDEPRWRNYGEARVVRDLVVGMRPHPEPRRHGYSESPLAVLTPYRQQLDILRADYELGDLVQTVHSFQGKEADIVVVSLVRDRLHGGDADMPWRSIGHLSQENLINVMMSRAGRLLVIVGNLAHYEQIGEHLEFWGRLCTAVRRFGEVVPAGEVRTGGPS